MIKNNDVKGISNLLMPNNIFFKKEDLLKVINDEKVS